MKATFLIFFLLFFKKPILNAQNRKFDFTETSNLFAFAKLFGYIKYFYAGDEARAIDWKKFSVYGVSAVKNAKTNKELKQRLEKIFKPIAPFFQLATNKKDLKITPQKKEKNETFVFWQHHGLGVDSNAYCYNSIRVGRDTNIHYPFIYNSIKADSFAKRKKFALSFSARKNADVKKYGWVMLEFYANRKMCFKKQINILKPNWENYFIEDSLPSKDFSLIIKAGVEGYGSVDIDDLKIFAIDSANNKIEIQIPNSNFEQYDDKTKSIADWQQHGSTFKHRLKVENNNAYLSLINTPKDKASVKLFDRSIKANETFNTQIGEDLYCAFPLGLYLPNKKSEILTQAFKSLKDSINNVDSLQSPFKKENWYAAVINLWNDVQHFYPYFENLNLDWNDQLFIALVEMSVAKTPWDVRNILMKMMHHTKDKHGFILNNDPYFNDYIRFPAITNFFKDSVVVKLPFNDSLKTGDMILAVNDVPVKEIVKREMELYSGSERSNAFLVSRVFNYGLKGENLKVDLVRNGQKAIVNIMRHLKTTLPSPARKFIVKELEPGIWFLNLNILTLKQWDSMLPTLMQAKGIIFDLSIYPKGTHGLLSHFIKKPIRSSSWSVPEIIYPDRKNKFEFDTTAFWFTLPKAPFLKAKVVYITSNQAQSYAESFLEQVETYKLGAIIGQPTAGINGMVNYRFLPGGFYTNVTGAKVTKQNGGQLFLNGITPNFYVAPDYNSLINGIDKELNKALEIIKIQVKE